MLGRLLNEYLVDMFSSVDIRHEVQSRIAARQELDETIDADGGCRAGRVASFMGSPRRQRRLIADGLTIVTRHGKSTYFLTATCNPNWPEIRNHPGMDGQGASDRPDVTCRVFPGHGSHDVSEILSLPSEQIPPPPNTSCPWYV